jgi:hypothetical protein
MNCQNWTRKLQKKKKSLGLDGTNPQRTSTPASQTIPQNKKRRNTSKAFYEASITISNILEYTFKNVTE